MTSIYVEVHVPALNTCMDLLVPTHITVRKAIALMVEIIDKKEQIALDPNRLSLFDMESGALLDEDAVFDAVMIPDACALILI